MISRRTISLPVGLLIAVLFAPCAPAQMRGMASPRARGGLGIRTARRTALVRGARHHTYGWIFYPYYAYGYDQDDYDREPPNPEVSRGGEAREEPEQRQVAAARPVESLILENRGGQWVRIPTGSQVPISSQNITPQSNLTTGIIALKEAPIKLPPALLVFRDGHQEEVERYVVQGNVLYISSDYWSTGSWTRKIPISELDLPETAKLNATRGSSFSLPTKSNEVVVRF